MSPVRRDPCVVCQQEILSSECMFDGEPAIVGWIPPGTPSQSVYAIVSAHLRCCGIPQLRQALLCWQADDEREKARGVGYRQPARIVWIVEKRLSELLARENLTEHVRALEAEVGLARGLQRQAVERAARMEAAYLEANREIAREFQRGVRYGLEHQQATIAAAATVGVAVTPVRAGEVLVQFPPVPGTIAVDVSMPGSRPPTPVPAVPRPTPEPPEPPGELTRFSLLEVDK